MMWMKFVLTALICVPLCLGVYMIVGYLLHSMNSGHTEKETMILKILKKEPHGISTPPLKELIAPVSAVGENLIKGVLDSLLNHEVTKYKQSYGSRITRDDFYISGGALADRRRLEDLITESATKIKSMREANSSEIEMQNFHDKLDIAHAHLASFNAKNACSIGIVRLVRMVRLSGTAHTASTIELIPVTNEAGTLLKFKLWKLRVDYAKCLVSIWRRRLDCTIGLRLIGVSRNVEGQFVQDVLLDDAIEIRGLEIGRTYTSNDLPNLETGWFPFPARLEYSMGFNQGPDTTEVEKDFGNYTLSVLVVEQGG